MAFLPDCRALDELPLFAEEQIGVAHRALCIGSAIWHQPACWALHMCLSEFTSPFLPAVVMGRSTPPHPTPPTHPPLRQVCSVPGPAGSH